MQIYGGSSILYLQSEYVATMISEVGEECIRWQEKVMCSSSMYIPWKTHGPICLQQVGEMYLPYVQEEK